VPGVDFDVLGVINCPNFEIAIDMKDYNVLKGW